MPLPLLVCAPIRLDVCVPCQLLCVVDEPKPHWPAVVQSPGSVASPSPLTKS
jgi:hypothetical protein